MVVEYNHHFQTRYRQRKFMEGEGFETDCGIKSAPLEKVSSFYTLFCRGEWFFFTFFSGKNIDGIQSFCYNSYLRWSV